MIDPRLANSPTLRLARRTFIRPLVERRLNPGHQISGSDYTVTAHDAAANLLPIRVLRRDLMAQRRKDSNWDDFVNYVHAATEPVSLVNDKELWAPIPLVTAHAPHTRFDNLCAALRHAREGQKGIILEGRRGSGKTGLLEKCWLDSLLAPADRDPSIPIWLPWVDFGKRTSQPQTSAHTLPMPPESLALTQLLQTIMGDGRSRSDALITSWLKNSPPLLILCDSSPLEWTGEFQERRKQLFNALQGFQSEYGRYGHQCVVTVNTQSDPIDLSNHFVRVVVGEPTCDREWIVSYPARYARYVQSVEKQLANNRVLRDSDFTTPLRIESYEAVGLLDDLWKELRHNPTQIVREANSTIGTPLLMFAATQLPSGCSEKIDNELKLLEYWRRRLNQLNRSDAPPAQSTVAMLDSILRPFEERTSTVQARPERPSQISVPTFPSEPTPPPQQVSPVPESVDAPFIRPIVARPPVKKQTSPLIRALALICMLLPVAIAMVDSPWRARPATPPRERIPQTSPSPPPSLESPPRFDTAPTVPLPNGIEPPQPVISRPPTPQISLAFHRGSPFGNLDSPDSQQDQLSKPYEYLQPAKLLIEQGLAYEGAGAEVLSGIEHTGTQLWYCDSSISQSKLPRQLECRFTDHTKHEPAQNQRWLLLLAVHPTKREWRLVKGEFQSKAGEGKSGTEYVVGFNTLSLRDWLLPPNDDNVRLALWLFYQDPQPDIERLHVCETPY